jgi:hypothetical protein
MGNTHGGRKVKICFDSNEQGEIQFEIKEIAYPHSFRSKQVSGSGEWVLWEQKCFHRPAQALQELCLTLKEKQFFTPTMGKDFIVFLIENKLIAPEDLYSLSKEPDDEFGRFFKVLIKGLYGFDMNKIKETK